MSKSTHRENERLQKMGERVDARAAELQRLARQQREELERLTISDLLMGHYPSHFCVRTWTDFESDAQVVEVVDERTLQRIRRAISRCEIEDSKSLSRGWDIFSKARAGLEPYASMHRQNVEQATAKHNLDASGPVPWEPMSGLVPPGTTVTISSSSTGTVADMRPEWRADFQHVLDALEYLGHISKITPIDGLPEHVVIELADGGGWLYYGPDQGLRTLTAKQARHYLACEAERHVEEGVWA